jgi:hypothetical protein
LSLRYRDFYNARFYATRDATPLLPNPYNMGEAWEASALDIIKADMVNAYYLEDQSSLWDKMFVYRRNRRFFDRVVADWRMIVFPEWRILTGI